MNEYKDSVKIAQVCPNCGCQLKPVRQSSSSYLNSDQFDAIRAGDYYCEICPEESGTGKKASSGYAYFWKKDVIALGNDVINDYFNLKKLTAKAHDKLLKMFGISEHNNFEIKDLRDRTWSISKNNGNATYIRFTIPDDSNSSTTSARLAYTSESSSDGFVLVQASFNVGGPIYFLFSESKQIDSFFK